MVTPDFVDELFRSDLVDDPGRDPVDEPRNAIATARRRFRWGREAALAAIAAGALGAFFGLTRAIASKRGRSVDVAVLRWIGRGRGRFADGVVRAITELGAVPAVTALSVGSLVLARRSPRLALQLATGALGGVIAELGLKRFFRRPRPRLLAHLEDVGSTSFPSGHAMAAASFYLTLAFVGSRSRRLRARRAELLFGAGTLATAIAASRVYLGVHWPTDVAGGLALGTAWACLGEAAFDLDAARALVETTPPVTKAQAGVKLTP